MLRHCAYIVTFVPSVLRWRLAETKPGARRTETSVASVRSSISRRWFAGSTVNTLIRVIRLLFVEIVVMRSPQFSPTCGSQYQIGDLLRMRHQRQVTRLGEGPCGCPL